MGSVSVITDEAGHVVINGRLSYDAWGLPRNPDGSQAPAGVPPTDTTRGFTGHEHLAEVGLIHMNGRVYDPLLARFGSPDPMTEDPFSTQGWNRYSYVGNSPVNFADPSGYCFMGCFWKPMFAAVGQFIQKFWGAILQTVAPALICGPAAPVCAAVVGAVVTTFVVGVSSGNLGQALRAGFTSFFMSMITQSVLESFTPRAAANPVASSYSGPSSSPSAGTFGAAESLQGQGGPELAQTQLPPIEVETSQNTLPPALRRCLTCTYGHSSVNYDAVNFGASLLPWVSIPIAMRDFQKSWSAGHYLAASIAILGVVPGGKLLTKSLTHLHHSWPKYLGGPVNQTLVPLPRAVHEAYHSGLDRILPRQRGTAYYQGLSAPERDLMLQDLRDYTRAFDATNGTKLYDAMIRNGFPLP